MNTATTCQIVSTSSDATEKLGEQLGKRLKGGEAIELISDLGGGKTTFIRGLVRGMGSRDQVASPTFTISKVYKSPKLELHHFDFYRLTDPGHIEYELSEVVNDPKVVVAVEWATIVSGVMPGQRLTLQITTLKDNKRRLTFNFAQELAYLMEGLC